MDKESNALFGINKEPVETLSHSDMMRQNLLKKRETVVAEISLLQGQLDDKKEYLAKIDGGIDVLDELSK
mgnify:CR=1 FL=1